MVAQNITYVPFGEIAQSGMCEVSNIIQEDVMAIQDIGSTPYLNPLVRKEVQKSNVGQAEVLEATGTAKQDASANTASDRVTVSFDAVLRGEALKAASSAPDVRQDKVDEIKERVDTGQYLIDSQNIAKRMLEMELELTRS